MQTSHDGLVSRLIAEGIIQRKLNEGAVRVVLLYATFVLIERFDLFPSTNIETGDVKGRVVRYKEGRPFVGCCQEENLPTTTHST